MGDYGRDLEFGISLVPEAAEVERLFELTRAADEHGLDLIGIQDHPYQRRFLDTFALIPALAAVTERVRFFPDVANLPLRPAPQLAKAAASLDVLSGGRFELGLGAGAFWEAIAAMGGPELTPKQSVDALEEAIGVMRAMWSGERSVSVEGEHYRLDGHKPGPEPPHRIGIWLGAAGPRMLGITGRLADGWVPSHSWLPPEKVPESAARIDRAARAAGRDPAVIRRAYNFSGAIERPREWVERLSGWATEAGLDTFVFWPDEPTSAQVEAFATEVAPAVRERVAALRKG